MNISHISCCGCGACTHVCPKNCINFKYDGEGFLKATAQDHLCINCGKCLKVCPINNSSKNLNQTISSYMGYNNDNDIKKRSTSGGIFYELGKAVVLSGGVVYGAAYAEDLSINHIRIDNINDLAKLQGSKYAQSRVHQCYPYIKTDLENGKTVLFSGTPCQVSAVKNLFSKSFEKQLITIDLICHGVPSQKLFLDYIKFIEKIKKFKILKYQFRCKEKSSDLISYNTKISVDKKNQYKQIIIDGNEDPYVLRFLSNCLQANTCYSCSYAQEKRCSDITLGDFWGFEKSFPEKTEIGKNGISLVLANTNIGLELLRKLENITLETISREDYINYNSHLSKPSQKNEFRDVLYKNYSKYGFTKSFYNKYFLPYKYKEYFLKRRILGWLK